MADMDVTISGNRFQFFTTPAATLFHILRILRHLIQVSSKFRPSSEPKKLGDEQINFALNSCVCKDQDPCYQV